MQTVKEARAALLLYDGKSAQPLRALSAGFEPSDASLRTFLRVAKHEERLVEIGATWVVKNLAERRKDPIPRDIAATLVARIASVSDSASRLHLLQTLPLCALGSASLRFLRDFLPALVVEEKHGLTRAWVFNGFAEIARCDPSFRSEAIAVLSEAYQTERAAVRARIRNALDDLN